MRCLSCDKDLHLSIKDVIQTTGTDVVMRYHECDNCHHINVVEYASPYVISEYKE